MRLFDLFVPPAQFPPSAGAKMVFCSPSDCNNETGTVADQRFTPPKLFQWYTYKDLRCPRYGHVSPGGCDVHSVAGKDVWCRRCYPTSAFVELAYTEHGIYGNTSSTDHGAATFLPICPPCVCAAHGLRTDECTRETLPDVARSGAGCRNLTLGGQTVKYCANAALN